MTDRQGRRARQRRNKRRIRVAKAMSVMQETLVEFFHHYMAMQDEYQDMVQSWFLPKKEPRP